MNVPTRATYEIMREPDIVPVARVLSHAFASSRESVAGWLNAAGLENMRVMRAADGSTPACLLRIVMGQYFAGRSVPMTGIAGVGVAPEARGRGLAAEMMRACLREIHAEGTPLSGLFCSTQALYRKVGYEQAGLSATIRLPVSRIEVKSRERRVRLLEPGDAGSIRACYARFAGRYNGMLDRGEYSWSRVARFFEVDHVPFGFFDAAGALQGYIYLSQQKPPGPGRHDVYLSDVAFLTPDAGRQILAFLADFEPTANNVVFRGSPSHPLLALLPQQRSTIEIAETWMLRITHLERALTNRVYPAGVRAGLTLDVRDEVIPEQNGLWALDVDEGTADLRRGDGGHVLRCSIGSLAAMFAGLYPASQSSILGWCEGDAEAIRTADALFPGSMAWMTDRF